MKIVLVGGDPETRELVEMAVRLRWPEAAIRTAVAAQEGATLVRRENPDAVMLYRSLPDLLLADAVCRIRSVTEEPLLILGQYEDEGEVPEALDLGADDYVQLPCNLADLSVRVWALVRRSRTSGPSYTDSWKFGPLVINLDNYRVAMQGRRLALTSTEFRLLHLLVKNRGNTLRHYTIEQSIWKHRDNSNRLVKKYVQRLRRKLGDDARDPAWIANVHGIGYRFIGPPDSGPSEMLQR